ncbi:MAG: amidohydrolase [Deltaproteobacteria bacterium]|nr:amidohydrolase [Deltaproteobacteria bacterium]
MKIDVFTHVQLQRYKKTIYGYADRFITDKNVQDRRPTLTDTDLRLQLIEKYEGYVQVLTATHPPLEEVFSPRETPELARMCNDEIAELQAKYPQKYVAAVANLPLNNMDATLKEAERAIKELGFRGVQIYPSVNGKPISSEEFMPLFEMMAGFDLPLWLHPMRRSSTPDFATEDQSYNQLFSIFGWPYDTTAAMTRLIFAGLFEKFPNVKIITHHCGAMVPYFAERIVVHYNNGLERLGADYFPGLTKHPVEYYRMFYADTALNGNTSALMCAYDFFGEDHMLFGTDMPYDTGNGDVSIRQTIEAVEGMQIPDTSKKKIFEENARRLLKL